MSEPRTVSLPALPADLQAQLSQAAAAVVSQWLHGITGGKTVAVIVCDAQATAILVHGNGMDLRAALPGVAPTLEKIVAQYDAQKGVSA